jgi:hypothetical protein
MPQPDVPRSPERTSTQPIVMKLDFELAPTLQTGSITDLLLDLFGRGILDLGLTHDFKAIKRTLLGLHVRTRYCSRTVVLRNASMEESSGTSDQTPPFDGTRRYIINQ